MFGCWFMASQELTPSDVLKVFNIELPLIRFFLSQCLTTPILFQMLSEELCSIPF